MAGKEQQLFFLSRLFYTQKGKNCTRAWSKCY